MRLRLILSTVALLSLAFVVACGDDDDDDGGDDGGATTAAGGDGTEVAVGLQEFAIDLDADSGPAGAFTFNITNAGPDDTHEFVVFKTDLAPDALPTADDGSVDEEGEGVELEGEVEDVAVDANETLELDLEAGKYVFICNIVEDGEIHYELGMRTGFTVE
jgi:hypothetical protein